MLDYLDAKEQGCQPAESVYLPPSYELAESTIADPNQQ
jgi:hypothetical protein